MFQAGICPAAFNFMISPSGKMVLVQYTVYIYTIYTIYIYKDGVGPISRCLKRVLLYTVYCCGMHRATIRL